MKITYLKIKKEHEKICDKLHEKLKLMTKKINKKLKIFV